MKLDLSYLSLPARPTIEVVITDHEGRTLYNCIMCGTVTIDDLGDELDQILNRQRRAGRNPVRILIVIDARVSIDIAL